MIMNVLLIGVQKAGTTSIYDWISQHPDIYAPAFAKDRYSYFLNEELYSKGYESYSKNFNNRKNEKLFCTGNANYFFVPHVAQRIYKLNPKMKMILMLRNPIDRAFSAFNHAIERGMETRSFEQAVQDEIENKVAYSALEKLRKSYIEHGFYFKQLSNYLNFFELDQIFVGFYTDLIKGKEKLMEEIFYFLDIEPDFKVNFSTKNVTGGSSRFKFINYILYDENFKNNLFTKKMKNVIPLKIRLNLINGLTSFNKKKINKKEIERTTKDILAKIYREDLLKLQDLLKKDLSQWMTIE